jgi:hypothetical protein
MRKKTISLSAQRLYHVNSQVCHRARNGTPKSAPKSAPKIVPFLPDQFRGLASLCAMSPGIPHDRLGIDETAHKFATREGRSPAIVANGESQIFILTYIDSME